MAGLTEIKRWEEEIFRIEKDTVWVGGEDGAANNQGRQLANRTLFLKFMIEELSDSVQTSSLIVATAGGTADEVTGIFTPGIADLTNGMTLYVRAASANATTTPTFTPNSGTIAAKTIVKGNGVALIPGDIAGTGHWIKLQYDETLDKWVLLNPAFGVTGATSVNDPSFVDNSSKPAATSWVRGAMYAIATAAGFVFSGGTNGYVKFPSWLGGVIFQWGSTPALSASADSMVSLSIAFPSAFYAVLMTQAYTINSGVVSYNGAVPYSLGAFYARASMSGQGNFFLAIGR